MGNKKLLWVVCVFVVTVGCKSESHLFNKRDREELKGNQEALLGQWVIVNEKKAEGKVLLDFEKGGKEELMLKIDNKPVKITTFRMMGGLDFIIEFKKEDGREKQLLGQFKSYSRSSLLVMNTEVLLDTGSFRSLTLKKLKTETELTASVKKN